MSLRSEVKRLIALRMAHPALQSKGTVSFLSDNYPLAYVRSSAEESILVIINPSASPAILSAEELCRRRHGKRKRRPCFTGGRRYRSFYFSYKISQKKRRMKIFVSYAFCIVFFVMFLLHNVAFFTMCLFLLQGSLQDCQNILFLQRCPGIFQALVFGNVMCHFGKS